LEAMFYEVLSRQAKLILNMDDLSNTAPQDFQLAKQSGCQRQINTLLDQKCALYEPFSQLSINAEEYQAKKREINRELDRLKHLKSMLVAQAEQVQMNEKAKTAKVKAAREIVDATGLTAGLCDTLLERVYVYPGN